MCIPKLSMAATYNVSGASQLSQALQKARGGDVISMAGGNYGSLDVSGKRLSNLKASSKIRIQSQSSSNPATFAQVSLLSVKNLEFNGIRVKSNSDGAAFFVNQSELVSLVNSEILGNWQAGDGQSSGVKITNSNGCVVSGSLIQDFYYGFNVFTDTGLDIINNDVFDISHDGMTLTKVHDVLIQNNHIRKASAKDTKHQDVIQFGNFGTSPAASDVRIIGNLLESPDTIAHGIYMGNGQAKKSNNSQYYYKNILIQDNDIRTGQLSGIGIGETTGLTITGNSVLRHLSLPKNTSEIRTPVIKVAKSARNVVVKNNETYKQPTAANSNWQDVPTPSGWVMSPNTIVKQ
jgi:hypothetical protein